KLLKGEKCILCQGRWFTPNAFEKFAGKEKCKSWKTSIRCRDTPLKKLIENLQMGGRGGGTEFRGRAEEEEEEEEDMADLSVFQASSLPVTCVSLTGTLYKCRFASGSRGKCIRTEERWFTPEEFVKQETILTDGHWKKDILCHGKTLNFLLKKEILHVHSLQCECVKCSTEEQANNDDECYVCYSEGDLVCCDECPRAFHSHCHLPTADGDSPGEWICTFCMLRNSLQWCDPQYSEVITQPMWLNRIKQKLESGEYQTVGAFISDFQLIFSNCSKFNGDNEFGRMGARLKQIFEEELRKISSIQ
uniref:SP110 nuclear body protein, tandem duplicate 2 n=1 Tax=Sinocyclocheilus grahami TaxID=75366 RepID=A0A672RX58_SINGR